jgi:hypothetical protein
LTIDYDSIEKILSEDWVLGKTIHANTASGVVDEMHFGRFELALIWFHDEHEKVMKIEPGVLVTDG